MIAMLKPSLWLSLLTAILTADISTINTTSSASDPKRVSNCQGFQEPMDEASEEQRINDEARHSLGSELLGL
jgi:hypothetical protein